MRPQSRIIEENPDNRPSAVGVDDEYDADQLTHQKQQLADEIAEAMFKHSNEDGEKISEHPAPKSNVSESANTMCRICFSDESEKDNPLISPCKCSGSMSHVHIKCLRQWLSRNENKKIGVHVTTYVWKAFHCELCKSKLEDSYTHGKKTF